MTHSLTFEIYLMDGATCGDFMPTNEGAWCALTNSFDDLLDNCENGPLPPQAAIKALKQFLKKEPFFFDAYMHLGLYLAETSQSQSAKWFLEGVERGKSLIPENFSGNIMWAVLNNRSFLRCHHGYILSLIGKAKYALAATEIEQHLAWNPSDSIGVCYLLGDAYLLSKQCDKAEAVFTKCMDEHPASCYGLGLIHFMKKDFVKAITYFRKGILSNPYIAEILTGKLEIIPKRYWHGISTASPDEAVDYMSSTGDSLWGQHEEVILFLDWLMNTSFILAERAQYVQQLEALLVEQSSTKRQALTKKQDALWDNITDKTSKPLVRKITLLRDGQCWPWDAIGWTQRLF